jgi:hypothetical protein
LNDVAGNHTGCRDLARGAIAHDRRALADALAEPPCRNLRSVRLREVQGNTEQDHQRDHDGAHDLPQRGRRRARQEQDDDERAGQPPGDLAGRLEPARGRELVRSEAPGDGRRLRPTSGLRAFLDDQDRASSVV